jgi:Lysozyme like domain
MARRRFRFRRHRDVTTALGAGLVLAAIVAAGGQHLAAAGAAGPAQLSAAGPGGTLSCQGLEALWESAGGSRDAAFTAAEIAMAESSGRQYATNLNGGRSTDRGYWQINSVHGSLSTFDPAGNARAAVLISSDGTNWSPWVTYDTGAYQGRC